MHEYSFFLYSFLAFNDQLLACQFFPSNVQLFFFGQLEGGVSHLPLLDPSMRATPLSPSEWKKKLQAANNVDPTFSKEDSSNLEKKFLLLDVRNGNRLK